METPDYNRIDDFLLHRLEGQALADFQKKMKTDADFAMAVAEQKKSIDLLAKMGDVEMKLEVQEVQRIFESGSKPKSIVRKLRPWILAASVLLLLGVSFWMMQGSTSGQLFEEYYSAYDTGFGERGLAKGDGLKLAEASRLYQQQKYDQAFPILESVKTADDGKLLLMQGICQLELGNYNQAIQLFQPLILKKDPVFQHHASWYIAMTYLKSGDLEKCKNQLEQIITDKDPNGVYQQAAAKEILKKM